MLIPAVEDGLESYLRAALPLSHEVGDISFEAPSGTWAAQVNRVTVNCFLYLVSRSPLPPRPGSSRPGAEGGLERRAPLPMVQLSYLVSAWAGSTRDEHLLLGDVLTRLIAQQVLPPEHLSTPLSSNVQLTLAVDEVNRPRDLWGGLGGNLKASFTLLATVASDAYGWESAPRGVSSIEGMATPVPPTAAVSRPGTGDTSGLRSRRDADGVLRSTVADGGA
ncbi:DUF4255 domain-containing protein [Actinotalea sp. K2]|uniref:DUF4255 domain-containing protein n=1 Tax=Actinotalea sp. K2 TaxID=2939438 RepID=UPI002017B73A|nr:DUF4255 domain-containing protein [Actinotalea sp. K2]MCL3861866.1 DUF4255 domain-containing protein [Actinotalea sp. K2]